MRCFLRGCTLSVFSSLFAILTVVIESRVGQAAAPAITGLIFNEDCTNFFFYHPIPDGKAGETIDRYVDVYAAAGAKILLCNTNAQRTNYRSHVWDAFWDGYDPTGPDTQPFLSALPRESVSKYRAMIHRMLEVDRQGIDYPARFIARCRYHGISPWISLRMNDCHDMENPDHPIHGRFWKEHPQFRIQGIGGNFGRCLDYAHQEVRDYFKSLIVETLERYDLDGLELNFLREPYVFSKGKETEGRTVLTSWMCEIHKLVTEASKKRGHPIRLGVRVPSRPETAKAFGLDAVAWTQKGLVDLVAPGPRWATIEFDIPIRCWRELLAGSRAVLAGGLEVNYRPHPGLRPRPVTPGQAAGAAAVILDSGAHAVYLHNYFQDGSPGWPLPIFQETLQAMNSLEALQKLPRTVCLTYRDVCHPDERVSPPLPAKGKLLSFSLPRGPLPHSDSNGVLLLALSASQQSPAAVPAVCISNQSCAFLKEESRDAFREISYSIPHKVLALSPVLKIRVSGKGETLTVHRLEVSLP